MQKVTKCNINQKRTTRVLAKQGAMWWPQRAWSDTIKENVFLRIFSNFFPYQQSFVWPQRTWSNTIKEKVFFRIFSKTFFPYQQSLNILNQRSFSKTFTFFILIKTQNHQVEAIEIKASYLWCIGKPATAIWTAFAWLKYPRTSFHAPNLRNWRPIVSDFFDDCELKSCAQYF